MKTENRNIYRCEYCSKYYLREHFAKRHELSCKKNPENWRACHRCQHLKMVETEIYEDHSHVSGYYRNINVLYCNKKSNYIHPPSVEIKGNEYAFGEILNLPMPDKCESIKFISILDITNMTDVEAHIYGLNKEYINLE